MIMKAVAYRTPGSIDRDDSLQDITLQKPTADGRGLLVRVHAVSVNPVDVKVRARAAPEDSEYRVLGFDASGVVDSVGPDVQNFKPGDAGRIRTTATETAGKIRAATLKEVHNKIESNTARGRSYWNESEQKA